MENHEKWQFDCKEKSQRSEKNPTRNFVEKKKKNEATDIFFSYFRYNVLV